ncbi:hypothetical protein PVAP13_6NG281532 [Panicum virgatum]|uniref:Uncharacterized protein n=1 Tax=Panicum virgatum TaxID=38727 RepID=A0A8T0R299_PANVG|nr:hypothetical protein PVAP13_6NG281532 [Panicum virgatum]
MAQPCLWWSSAPLDGVEVGDATTAPRMATSTTPPETMLRRKFLREGEMGGGLSAAAAAGDRGRRR